MSEEELIETLRTFEKNRVEQLEEPARNLFYAIMKIANERDRLNNIINELEKWLEEQHQFIIEIPAFTKEIAVEHKTMELCYESVLDKLQELKGSE